jgi:hypothetical protein
MGRKVRVLYVYVHDNRFRKTHYSYSGAGIGWMGDIFLNSNATNTTTSRSTPPLLPMIQSSVNSNTESCHDYLQTLLNVNNELVTQSLTSPSANNHRLYNTHGDDPNNIASTVSKHPLLSPPLTETDVVNHGTTANLISQSILRTQRQDSLHQFCSPPEE